MGNRADELACLELAIKKCIAQRGITKKIGLLLSGEDVVREDDERPDFLRYAKPNNCNKGITIGIEHFRVDHFSKELTNERVGSTGILYEKNLKKTFNKWKPHVSKDTEIPEGALDSIGELVAQAMEHRIQATYNAFIESFRYSLNKHLESIDHYHAVISRYAKDSERKLAFLIEIHSDFRTLFFHDKNGMHHDKNTCPLFEDIVRIMETINHHKVHYLILCFGSTIYNEETKVIAVPTHNIRNQFARLNIPIYHYAGHDIFLSGFQTPRLDLKTTSDYEVNGDNIDFHVAVSSRNIKDEKKLEMIVEAYKIIKQFERKKYNYATTEIVEMFYAVWDEWCADISDKPAKEILGLIPFISRANAKQISANYAQFNKKLETGESYD